MKNILELLSALTMAGSVAALSLLLLRLMPDDKLSAAWRYRLSKLTLALYLIPVAPFAALLKPLFAPQTAGPALAAATSNSAANVSAAGTLRFEAVLSAGAAALILGVWAAGLLIYSAWQMFAYRKVSRMLIRTSFPAAPDDEAQQHLIRIAGEMGIRKSVALARNPLLRSPVLAGLRRPTVYLPLAATADLDMVLRHELTHLRRRDLQVKLWTAAAASLHWFNPLVYLARRDLHLWSELSCDAEVVTDLSREDRKRYGQALITAAAGADRLHAGFFSPLSGDGKQLKRRLTLMLNSKKFKKKTVIWASSAALAVAMLGTTAAVWAAENTPSVTEARPVPAESATAESGLSITVPATVPQPRADDTAVSEAVPVPEQTLAGSETVTVPVAESSPAANGDVQKTAPVIVPNAATVPATPQPQSVPTEKSPATIPAAESGAVTESSAQPEIIPAPETVPSR